MPAIFAALAGISVTLFVIGLFRPNATTAARRRIERLHEPARTVESLSFSDRVLTPAAGQVTGFIMLLMPSRLYRSTISALETAGLRVSPSRFVTIWVMTGLFVPLLGILAAIAARRTVDSEQLLGVILWIAAGLVIPPLWLRMRARRRTRAIDHALPDAIDLIVTNVEAGVGLQAAMMNVAQKFTGPVAVEFDRVIREGAVGQPRDEALDAMGRRTASRDMQTFVRAIIQAERNGIPIASVLHAQARELRERRRQMAREQANRIPIKITIPTVLFMFPTIFLLILGPVILGALEEMARR